MSPSQSQRDLIIFCTPCHYATRLTLRTAEISKRSRRDCRDLSRSINGTEGKKTTKKKTDWNARGNKERDREEINVEGRLPPVVVCREGRVFCIDPRQVSRKVGAILGSRLHGTPTTTSMHDRVRLCARTHARARAWRPTDAGLSID